jgi:hypothetical protein
MYEPGKILAVGGADEQATQAQSSAEIIDLTATAPAWVPTGAMHYRRQQATATLLPNGQVLVTNGTQHGGDPDASYEAPGQAVLPAEIWDPATGVWTVMNSSPEARTYHSNALLLPDGRVLVNGGGQGGGGIQPNGALGVPDHPNADLFSPPYLFQGARPALTSAPKTLLYGKSFQVLSSDATSIRKVSLVRLGATTHAFNQNQRFQWLSVKQVSPNALMISAPASANLAPPGYYMLFLLNANGVPSQGQIVRVGN